MAGATTTKRKLAGSRRKSLRRRLPEFPPDSLEAKILAIGRSIPESELEKIPPDYFGNLDHYLHGAAKKK
jgi:hypothetical protein